MEEVDSSEMVEAERCWGRRVEDPGLAEELRRQAVVEVVVGSTAAAGTGQVEDKEGDKVGDRGEDQDQGQHT